MSQKPKSQIPKSKTQIPKPNIKNTKSAQKELLHHGPESKIQNPGEWRPTKSKNKNKNNNDDNDKNNDRHDDDDGGDDGEHDNKDDNKYKFNIHIHMQKPHLRAGLCPGASPALCSMTSNMVGCEVR